MNNAIYQVSTLQALLLGYTKSVVTVEELLKHGDVGLGTFENVDGEMIVVDGDCFKAIDNGEIERVETDEGISFACVANTNIDKTFSVENIKNVDELKDELNAKIEEVFGLNSMHIIRIDGFFNLVDARSENGYPSTHLELRNILKITQKSFCFENIEGTLICLYFPDYMDGINLPGWHFHFISKNRTKGGHVFNVSCQKGVAKLTKLTNLEIKLPESPAFDTYALKESSQEDAKSVEQNK